MTNYNHNTLSKENKQKKTPALKTPALMLQGTSSHVGKSLLTAAFCRYYQQQGLKVAPFKAQNMSSNVYYTQDKLAISTAQAMQAQAAKVAPDVRMNPIMLCPTKQKDGSSGVEVFWLGKSQGIMNIKEYFAQKDEYFRKLCQVYTELANEYELIVIEGAGSPAEINLKDQDIVNMKIAKFANAEVVLIGDIERGGVFASLFGTLELLEADEQRLIKAFIINKFRGDLSLLDSGLEMLSQRTGKPFLGVLPYVDPKMPEEDSLGTSTLPCPRTSCDLSKLDQALDDLAALIKKHLNLNYLSPNLNK